MSNMRTLAEYITESVSNARLKRCIRELKTALKNNDYSEFMNSIVNLVVDNQQDVLLPEKCKYNENYSHMFLGYHGILGKHVLTPIICVCEWNSEWNYEDPIEHKIAMSISSLKRNSDEKIIKIFGSSQNMMKEIIRQLEVKSKLN